VIADTKPVHIKEVTRSYFDTHTPLVIEFDEEDRGKTFWYAVRWENTRGEKGPWSEIMSAIIP
jgi:peptide methionine sulfoxide reductase MsrA